MDATSKDQKLHRPSKHNQIILEVWGHVTLHVQTIQVYMLVIRHQCWKEKLYLTWNITKICCTPAWSLPCWITPLSLLYYDRWWVWQLAWLHGPTQQTHLFFSWSSFYRLFWLNGLSTFLSSGIPLFKTCFPVSIFFLPRLPVIGSKNLVQRKNGFYATNESYHGSQFDPGWSRIFWLNEIWSFGADLGRSHISWLQRWYR